MTIDPLQTGKSNNGTISAVKSMLELLLQKVNRHDDYLMTLTTDRVCANAKAMAIRSTVGNRRSVTGQTPPQGIRLDFIGIAVSSVASSGETNTMALTLNPELQWSIRVHLSPKIRGTPHGCMKKNVRTTSEHKIRTSPQPIGTLT